MNRKESKGTFIETLSIHILIQSNLQGRCCSGHLRVKNSGAPRSKVICMLSLVSKGWSQFEGEAPPASRAVTTPQCGLGSLEEANSPSNPPEFCVQRALVLHICSKLTFSITKVCALEWKECYSGFKSEDEGKSTQADSRWLALIVFISFRFHTVYCSEDNYSPYRLLLRDGVVDATKIEAPRVNVKHNKYRSGQQFSFIRIPLGVYIAYIFQK